MIPPRLFKPQVPELLLLSVTIVPVSGTICTPGAASRGVGEAHRRDRCSLSIGRCRIEPCPKLFFSYQIRFLMKIEHLAYNVTDPLNLARWYVEHLGFTVRRRMMEPPYAHFLADDSGTVMLEVYGNTEAPRLDFHAVEPPAFHLAFLSRDLAADVRRLTAAGATIVADVHTMPSGDTFAMLRDPWGVPLQLVSRREPMI